MKANAIKIYVGVTDLDWFHPGNLHPQRQAITRSAACLRSLTIIRPGIRTE